MNVGSLFSGIGGFDLGLERAGMRVVWQCEANEYRRRVLAKHWPGVPCFEDVCDVRSGVERVDLICGGFPCQDLSVAGKGAGIDGARSGLWSEFARIIGELRPRYVVVENVPALLYRGAGRVIGDLAACGYDAEWDCLPAAAFGAPHIRDRLWIIAYQSGHGGGTLADPGRERGPGRGEAGDVVGSSGAGQADGRQRERNGNASDDRGADVADANRSGLSERRRAEPVRAQQPSAQRGGEALADSTDERCEGQSSFQGQGQTGRGRLAEGSPEMADTTGQRWSGSEQSRQDLEHDGSQPSHGHAREGRDAGWWSTEPDVGRVAHGVPARVDRLSALGDALVPQIAEWIGRRILEWERAAA